jgi:hypothetical protein
VGLKGKSDESKSSLIEQEARSTRAKAFDKNLFNEENMSLLQFHDQNDEIESNSGSLNKGNVPRMNSDTMLTSNMPKSTKLKQVKSNEGSERRNHHNLESYKEHI